jgi:hypothetical protein
VVSFVSGRISEAAGSYMIQSVDSFSFGLRFINWSLLDLFKVAFNKGYAGTFDYANRIVIDSGAQVLKRPENEWEWDAWNEKNAVSYEIATSRQSRDRIFDDMQRDLMQKFPFKATVERQKRPVLLLIKRNAASLPPAQGKEKSLLILKDSIILKNVPVANLVRVMNQQYQALLPPVIDETGISVNIDAVIEAGLDDPFQLRAALHKVGLDLISAERECDMLVISKRI